MSTSRIFGGLSSGSTRFLRIGLFLLFAILSQLKASNSYSQSSVINLSMRDVTIEQVCRENLIGRSQLQKIFREQSGLGIIEYFSLMKVNAAKQLIRTNKMNFTQISEQLGYTSIHYFSRQFKKVTGMTPSEYASSIKAMADGDFKP